MILSPTTTNHNYTRGVNRIGHPSYILFSGPVSGSKIALSVTIRPSYGQKLVVARVI